MTCFFNVKAGDNNEGDAIVNVAKYGLIIEFLLLNFAFKNAKNFMISCSSKLARTKFVPNNHFYYIACTNTLLLYLVLAVEGISLTNTNEHTVNEPVFRFSISVGDRCYAPFLEKTTIGMSENPRD